MITSNIGEVFLSGAPHLLLVNSHRSTNFSRLVFFSLLVAIILELSSLLNLSAAEEYMLESVVATEVGQDNLDAFKCGRNALFLFFKLSGHETVRLGDFDIVPISSEGTSILSLWEAAEKNNLRTQIRRYKDEDLDELRLPAILPFSAPLGGLDHFNVLYKVDSKRVYLIDSGSGEKFTVDRATRLPQLWSGVALTASPPIFVFSNRTMLKLFLTGGLFCWVLVFFYFQKRKIF